MEKILPVVYTTDEFLEIVKQWRDEYAVNKLAVYPDPLKGRYFENLEIHVDQERGQVELKELPHELDARGR